MNISPSLRRLAFLCLAGTLMAAPGLSLAQRSSEPVTLNFVNADIEAVARTMATITGRNIVVDPRVKGTINLSTDRPVSPAAAFNQFLATLRLSGFTVVESAGLLQGGARSRRQAAGRRRLGGHARSAGNQIVTQIFRLNYEIGRQPGADPAAADQPEQHHQRQPRQQLAGDHRLRRQPAAHGAHHRRAGRVQRHRRGGHPAAHALATDLAPLVQRLVESGGAAAAPGAPARARPTPRSAPPCIAEPRSNTLIVRAANPARLNLVRSLVDKLDQPERGSSAAAATSTSST